LVDWIINKQGLPIGCAFLEEPAVTSAKRIAGKQANTKFFLPDAEYEQEDLEQHLRALDQKLWLYDHNGYKDWASIEAYFKFLGRSMGIKHFILDNLTAVVAQEEQENRALNAIMEKMASLAIELDASIYYASHLRKAAGTPHEEGGRVQLREFYGSGAMGKWSHFIFAQERNTQHPDPSERNTTIFRILKDRYTGLSTGLTFPLWYDHNTGIYREKGENDCIINEDF
jgi:twinkle protein